MVKPKTRKPQKKIKKGKHPVGKTIKTQKPKSDEKKKTGRPSKFDNYKRKKNLISLMYRRGFTDAEVAQALDVTNRTVQNWKKEEPEFFHTIKRDKGVADIRVEEALYERAIGYQHPDTDIKAIGGAIVTTDIIKHYAPDPTSMIFWLKNRMPDKWREKSETKFGIDSETAELILAALPPEYAKAVKEKLMAMKGK
jgi:transcriptional regulator with XRE-family HTH domain